MASLSNINGLFDVHSTGAILFSTSHGTSGQILKSNGNAAPTWVDSSTVIGGPYLPLSGGTLTGALAGTSATFSGEVSLKSKLNLQRLSGGATTLIQFKNENGVDRAHIDFGGTNEELSFFAGAGTVENMRIDSSGNVGIGETNPTYKFEVKGSGTNTLQRWTTTEGGALLLIPANDAANPDWTFIAGTNEDIQIDPANNDSGLIVKYNGNVGIGTTSPSNKLQIVQGHSILVGDYFQIGSGSSNIMGALGWNRDTTNGVIYNTSFGAFQMHNNQGKLCLQGYNASGVNQFQHEFYNNGNIFFDGNVGIKTTAPGADLEVFTLSGGSNTLRLNTNFGGGNTVDINPYISGVNNGGMEIKLAGSQKLVINPSGNVGIGTTNPGRGLTIDKSNEFASLEIIKNNTGNQIVYLGTGSSGASDLGILQLKDNNTIAVQLYAGGDSWLNGGNVGIGVTGPTEKLVVAGKVMINNTNAPNNLAQLNIGYTGSGETRAIDIDGGWSSGESKSISFTYDTGATNLVGQINCQHNGPGSRIRWGKLYHNGTSSTYTMELISTSQTAANLTVAGNIGINTTTPQAKLDVAGDITIQNGLYTYKTQGYTAGSSVINVDITVGNEGGGGNVFKIEAGFAHYFGMAYNSIGEWWCTSRGTGVINTYILNAGTSLAGSWSSSKPNTTTLRVTKSAGTYAGGGKWWIKVTYVPF